MKKIYRLGILGLGEGRSVISAALSSPHWEIGNICDLNESLCQQRCKEFGLTDYTTRYEDLLRDPQIDVIGIYTPDQLHSLHIRRKRCHLYQTTHDFSGRCKRTFNTPEKIRTTCFHRPKFPLFRTCQTPAKRF